MTLRFLLDTNAVSEPAAKRPNAKLLKRLKQHASECAIAAPVWHELNYGVRRLPQGRRRARLEAYLGNVVSAFPILPYDEDAATWHAMERSRLERQGTPVPFVDGQIASIAHSLGLILVTANVGDFSRFQGLQVQDWTG